MADRELDRQARFRRVYDDSFQRISDYARRRVAPSEVADVVADVFLVVWRRFDDVPPGSEAMPWTYGVARRVVAEHRRSARRSDRLNARLKSTAPRDRGGPEGSDRAVEVEVALSRLRSLDRELLMLTYWDELKPVEIAALLGVSVNAVVIRLHRARRRFAAALARIEASEGEVL